MKLFFCILVAVLSGCSASRPPLEQGIPLVPSLEVDTSAPAFEKALSSKPGSQAAELARIEYLLERIGNSPYNFIRNGNRYNGRHAEAHLRWKYLRNLQQIKTAEGFIDSIATRSKISGEPYGVVLPNKIYRPLREFLLYELHLLDQALEKRRSSE